MKSAAGVCLSLAFLFTEAYALDENSRDIEGQPGTPDIIVKECPRGHSYDARTRRCREEIRELGVPASPRHSEHQSYYSHDNSRSEGQVGTNTIVVKKCPPGHTYSNLTDQCLER